MSKAIRRMIGIGGIYGWLLVVGGTALADGPASQWVLVDREEGESDFYYDKGSMTRADLLNVWVKVVYGPDGKADALELLGNPELYGPLAATHYQYEISCATGQSRLIVVSHRDGAGKVLREFNLAGKTGWEKIPYGSRLEQLSEAECPPPSQ